MRIVYRGSKIINLCEQQLNRMKAAEPQSIEIVVYASEVILRTNKGNHYQIRDDRAILMEVVDDSGSEHNKVSAQDNG